MKKKLNSLIVHVGMHKTGSTSIQDTLSKNYCGEQYTYLDLGTVNHNHMIYSLFTEKPGNYYLNKNFDISKIEEFNKNSKELLKKKLMECITENVIISGEDIIQLSQEELIKMKLFFDDYFEDIIIIAYVRTPLSYITSLLQQVIKSGVGFERLMNDNRRSIHIPLLNLNMLYPNYEQTFTKFENVFGKNNLVLRLFDKKQFFESDVVLDFFHYFNINIEKKNVVRSNESLSQEVIAIAYSLRKCRFNGKCKLNDSELTKIIQELSLIKGNNFKLSCELIKPILKKYQSDINWLENKMGIKIEETCQDVGAVTSERDIVIIDLKYYDEAIEKLMISSLSSETKKIIENLIHNVNLLGNTQYIANVVDFFVVIRDKIRENYESADILREVAFAFEQSGDVATAFKIMEQAHLLRPNGPVIIQKIEEYKSILEKQVLDEGIEGIQKVGHRNYVGGMWDEIGRLQFDFLVAQGLKPEHTLLDIACGSLRGGIHFINYLDRGNYLGIDKEQELIKLGIEKELGTDTEQVKKPEFVISDKFEFNKFSKVPDYSIAQSLFTHLIEKDIRLCLQNLKSFVGHNPHKFFATFFECDEPKQGDLDYSHSFFYTKEQMEQFGKKTGWQVEYIGDWNHPRNQKIMMFFC